MVKERKFTHIIEDDSLNDPVDVTLSASDINFIDGYGVASFQRPYLSIDTSSKEEINFKEETLTYRAIVNEDLEEILPFKGSYINIENFKNGNFLVTQRFIGKGIQGDYKRNEHYHMQIQDGKISIVNKFFEYSYQKIDEETILVDGIFYDITHSVVIDPTPNILVKKKTIK